MCGSIINGVAPLTIHTLTLFCQHILKQLIVVHSLQDSLGNLLGGTTTTAPSHPTITVFDKHGIVVSFSFAKPAGQPEVTHITATYINNGVTPVTDFNLQVCVTLSGHSCLLPPHVCAHNGL